jgi:cell division septation protein DedD
MADITKQRLIGALLVLTVILIAALFLVDNANENIDEINEILIPEFQSSIETTENEVIDSQQEALIDPHNLGGEVAAAIENETSREAVSGKSESEMNVTNAEIRGFDSQPKIDLMADSKSEPIAIKILAEVDEQVTSIDAKVMTSQWTIQLASFGVKDNAESLQKKLKRLELQADIQGAVNSQGKMIYRVRIGPKSNRQQVDTIVSKVKRHFQLNPQVIKLQ